MSDNTGNVSEPNVEDALKEPIWVAPTISVLGVTAGVALSPSFQANMPVGLLLFLALVFMMWGFAWGASAANSAGAILRRSASSDPELQDGESFKAKMNNRLSRAVSGLLGTGGLGVLTHSLTVVYNPNDGTRWLVVVPMAVASVMIIVYVARIGFTSWGKTLGILVFWVVVTLLVLWALWVSLRAYLVPVFIVSQQDRFLLVQVVLPLLGLN